MLFLSGGEISFAVKPYLSPDKNTVVMKKHTFKKLTRCRANGYGQLVLHHLEQSIAQLWPLGSPKAKQNRRSLQVGCSKTGLWVE